MKTDTNVEDGWPKVRRGFLVELKTVLIVCFSSIKRRPKLSSDSYRIATIQLKRQYYLESQTNLMIVRLCWLHTIYPSQANSANHFNIMAMTLLNWLQSL